MATSEEKTKVLAAQTPLASADGVDAIAVRKGNGIELLGYDAFKDEVWKKAKLTMSDGAGWYKVGKMSGVGMIGVIPGNYYKNPPSAIVAVGRRPTGAAPVVSARMLFQVKMESGAALKLAFTKSSTTEIFLYTEESYNLSVVTFYASMGVEMYDSATKVDSAPADSVVVDLTKPAHTDLADKATAMETSGIPGSLATLGEFKQALRNWAVGGGKVMGSVGTKAFDPNPLLTTSDDTAAIASGSYNTFVRMDPYANNTYFHYMLYTTYAACPVISIIYNNGGWIIKKLKTE